MKALKIFGIIAALVVALLIAAIVILPMVIDPNDYRDDITAITKEKTGLDLSLEGDLSLSVFPWLGVYAQNALSWRNRRPLKPRVNCSMSARRILKLKYYHYWAKK